MQIKEFRYLTTDDRANPIREARSRAYEYEWIIQKLEEIKPMSVHNTACGLGTLHISFATYMTDNFVMVENSDNESRPTEDRPINFYKYDILDKSSKEYEATLCISTLEHIAVEQMMLAFENLLDQTKE